MNMPRNSIQKKEQTIRIDSENSGERRSSGSQQNVNFDYRDPTAPVIRDNGNLGAMATDLSISQLPREMSTI